MRNLQPLKQSLQRYFKRLGLEIRKTAPDLSGFMSDRQIDTVLDVGGNVGQFGAFLRHNGYRGKIISFEPIGAAFEILSRKAAADGLWDVMHCALGAEPGHATINISAASVFSSVLPSTRAAAQFDAQAAVIRTEQIEVRTLDSIGIDTSGNVLLKIDTQGFEQSVLRGGVRTVPAMKGILMELPIIHLYQGVWQFHEAVAYMSERGFVPAQIQPVNYHSADRVSLVEVDCLFRPRDSQLDGALQGGAAD